MRQFFSRGFLSRHEAKEGLLVVYLFTRCLLINRVRGLSLLNSSLKDFIIHFYASQALISLIMPVAASPLLASHFISQQPITTVT